VVAEVKFFFSKGGNVGEELQKKGEGSGGIRKGYIVSATIGFLVAIAIVGGIIFILRNTDQQSQNTSSSVPGVSL
jgi:hypothetical protein